MGARRKKKIKKAYRNLVVPVENRGLLPEEILDNLQMRYNRGDKFDSFDKIKVAILSVFESKINEADDPVLEYIMQKTTNAENEKRKLSNIGKKINNESPTKKRKMVIDSTVIGGKNNKTTENETITKRNRKGVMHVVGNSPVLRKKKARRTVLKKRVEHGAIRKK